MDAEVISALASLQARMMSLEASKDTDRPFPIWPNQRVNHFIPESSNTNRVIAWGCTNSGLVITVTPGNVYFKGVSTSILSTPVGWPDVTIAATTWGYIEIDLAGATATWKTAASDPGDGDYDTEIWRIFVATVAGGAITELLECQHGDIHIPANA